MINTQFYPNCCTAYTMDNFGNTSQYHKDNTKYTLKETIQHIKEQLNDLPKAHALVTAITNSEQIIVHKALKKCGFKRVKRDFKKLQHPETTLQLWFYAIGD